MKNGTVRTGYAVAGLNPFWRYAVAIEERPDLPAIPFFSEAAALVQYDTQTARFPYRTIVLLRRRWRCVDVIRESVPSQDNPS